MSDEERRIDTAKAVGNLEGKMDMLITSVTAHGTKIDALDKRLTAQSIKVAGLAGFVTAAITGAYHFLKGGG